MKSSLLFLVVGALLLQALLQRMVWSTVVPTGSGFRRRLNVVLEEIEANNYGIYTAVTAVGAP